MDAMINEFIKKKQVTPSQALETPSRKRTVSHSARSNKKARMEMNVTMRAQQSTNTFILVQVLGQSFLYTFV